MADEAGLRGTDEGRGGGIPRGSFGSFMRIAPERSLVLIPTEVVGIRAPPVMTSGLGYWIRSCRSQQLDPEGEPSSEVKRLEKLLRDRSRSMQRKRLRSGDEFVDDGELDDYDELDVFTSEDDEDLDDGEEEDGDIDLDDDDEGGEGEEGEGEEGEGEDEYEEGEEDEGHALLRKGAGDALLPRVAITARQLSMVAKLEVGLPGLGVDLGAGSDKASTFPPF